MTAPPSPPLHPFLANGGALGALIAAFDWSATPPGAIEQWPAVLRNAVALILHSDVPMVLLWGLDGIMIYNDGYSLFAGARHPLSLGSKVRESWPEIADFNDHVVRTMLAGERLHYRGQELTVARAGVPEQVWLDLDYSPVVDEAGVPQGGLVLVHDVTHRIAAERAADQSREQFQTLTQALPNQVWTARADGALDWFNAQVYAFTGADPGTLDGNEAWTVRVHPADLPTAAGAWETALASGDTYETEFRIRRHDGAYVWHLVRALPVHDEAGHITRWIGTNTDIDEHKRAEARHARDRDRLWRLSQDLMLVCELSGIITAVNPTAERLLGWGESELVGRNLLDLLHPDDLAATLAEMGKLEQGVATLTFHNRYRANDGSYRLFEWSAVPDAGRIHAVARDITQERKLARDRDRIWNISPVLKLVLTPTGTILAANPSWTSTLGWDEGETIGRSVRDFIADDQAQHLPERLAGLAQGSAPAESEWLFKTRDGRLRRTQWTTVSESGTLYSFGRDVTEAHEASLALAAAEEALRQSQKMEAVGQLTGGIAHDFNNLLQGIIGSLEIIERRVEQGRTDELGRFVHGATTAAARAASLTHRLLAFSRRQPLDPRPVRVNPLIASIEDLLLRTLGEQTKLELALADGLWLTLCDANQLENAVINLAINARDAMPAGGRLLIETANVTIDPAEAAQQRDTMPGQYVRVAVTDSGTGMPAETIARAFEPFYTTKPIGQGTGLGLSMIYGFARQSDGHVRIESEVGHGTTVTLHLPRFHGTEQGPAAAAEESDVAGADAGETVLVIEDEPVVRALILEVLEELGYRTLEASDGTAGLAILDATPSIDLLVTDIGLPGLNGRQVAAVARARRPGLRILFMTGYAEEAVGSSGFLEPGMSMITKPFSFDAFAGRIRTILEDGAE